MGLASVLLAMVSVCDGAQAQTGFVPPDCQAYAQMTRAELGKRKGEIETRLAKLRAEAREVAGEEVKARRVSRDMQQQKEDLIEVMFALDCSNLAEAAPVRKRSLSLERAQPPPPPVASQPAPTTRSPQAPPAASPSPSAQPTPDAIEVTTYYATNRKLQRAAATPGETYGREDVSELTFGRAIVSVPASHTVGNIELPKLWKFERTADPSRHFVLKQVTPIANDAAKSELAEKLRASSARSMLVYVHGYYMGFEEAALRTAQLAYDLKFPGVAFFYSWPSANRVRAYLQDEETARLSEPVFESVLQQISALPVDAIYIVAHSMGNRIVGHGLQAYVDKGKSTKHIKELMLAAPDINAEIFRTAIVPRLEKMQNTRTTIYASSSDIALMASKVVHGFRRVGESSGGVFVYKGMDTVDASEAASSTRNFGHSYLVDSALVIKDLSDIVAKSLAAKARGLTQKGASPDYYWQLR